MEDTSRLGVLGKMKLIKIVFLNLIIFFVAIEILSSTAYWYKTGGFFYTRDQNEKTLVAQDKKDLSGNLFKHLTVLFHPFFGYVEKGIPGLTNNHGFRNYKPEGQCCDLPYIPGKNEIVIGVFGGSVAGSFGQWIRWRPHFRKILETYPQFKGKKLTFLNFAIGGYRQPQQLMILTYYKMLNQKLDVVLNIDGFNEVVTAFHNSQMQHDISHPATDVWFNMARFLEQVNMRGGDGTDVMASYHKWHSVSAKRSARRCSLASCWVFNKAKYWYHTRQNLSITSSNKKTWRDRSHFFLTEKRKNRDPDLNLVFDHKDVEALMKRQSFIWQSASQSMHKIAKDVGALYIQIIQPSILYSVDRVIPTKKKKHGREYLLKPLKSGYDKIRGSVPEMRKKDILVYDASGVFDSATEHVYADDVCHLNEKGQAIFSDFIAKSLADAMKITQWKPAE